ncbi:MAG: hypothetical protein JWO67_144 [Streptosporangiaceae bacterium]|nr:hypothetical protein [Streptosporangiaceae bacterium]
MTKIRLDSGVSTSASLALEPLASKLYASPGIRIVGVVELRHTERLQPAPETDKEPVVKLQVSALELARDDQEDSLRRAMRALFMHRTARGTIDEDGQVELSERTLELAAGELHSLEAARLHTALSHWADYAHRVLHTENITHTELLHELKALVDGLDSALFRDRGDDGEGGVDGD